MFGKYFCLPHALRREKAYTHFANQIIQCKYLIQKSDPIPESDALFNGGIGYLF
jgi:hypothetical protein